MNTHLIIPIKDIEDFISKWDTPNTISYNIGRVNSYKEILAKYKHISLDKKDIEEKAKVEYPENGIDVDNRRDYTCYDKQKGYKQALKDLYGK